MAGRNNRKQRSKLFYDLHVWEFSVNSKSRSVFFVDSVDFKKENKLNCVFQSLKNEKLGSVSFEN